MTHNFIHGNCTYCGLPSADLQSLRDPISGKLPLCIDSPTMQGIFVNNNFLKNIYSYSHFTKTKPCTLHSPTEPWSLATSAPRNPSLATSAPRNPSLATSAPRNPSLVTSAHQVIPSSPNLR
jgi:hypothetical protein